MEKWLKWASELQSLSQAGLAYAKDAYDKANRFMHTAYARYSSYARPSAVNLLKILRRRKQGIFPWRICRRI